MADITSLRRDVSQGRKTILSAVVLNAEITSWLNTSQPKNLSRPELPFSDSSFQREILARAHPSSAIQKRICKHPGFRGFQTSPVADCFSNPTILESAAQPPLVNVSDPIGIAATA